jgi:excisionase family DNA binding protein
MQSGKQKSHKVVWVDCYASSQRNRLQTVLWVLHVDDCKLKGWQIDVSSQNVISRTHQNGEGDSTMTEETREELLTVREVARRLRVDDTTVRRWIKSGALEAITLPHRGKRQAYRIKKTTLDKLLTSSVPAS